MSSPQSVCVVNAAAVAVAVLVLAPTCLALASATPGPSRSGALTALVEGSLCERRMLTHGMTTDETMWVPTPRVALSQTPPRRVVGLRLRL